MILDAAARERLQPELYRSILSGILASNDREPLLVLYFEDLVNDEARIRALRAIGRICLEDDTSDDLFLAAFRALTRWEREYGQESLVNDILAQLILGWAQQAVRQREWLPSSWWRNRKVVRELLRVNRQRSTPYSFHGVLRLLIRDALLELRFDRALRLFCFFGPLGELGEDLVFPAPVEEEEGVRFPECDRLPCRRALTILLRGASSELQRLEQFGAAATLAELFAEAASWLVVDLYKRARKRGQVIRSGVCLLAEQAPGLLLERERSRAPSDVLADLFPSPSPPDGQINARVQITVDQPVPFRLGRMSTSLERLVDHAAQGHWTECRRLHTTFRHTDRFGWFNDELIKSFLLPAFGLYRAMECGRAEVAAALGQLLLQSLDTPYTARSIEWYLRTHIVAGSKRQTLDELREEIHRARGPRARETPPEGLPGYDYDRDPPADLVARERQIETEVDAHIIALMARLRADAWAALDRAINAGVMLQLT